MDDLKANCGTIFVGWYTHASKGGDNGYRAVDIDSKRKWKLDLLFNEGTDSKWMILLGWAFLGKLRIFLIHAVPFAQRVWIFYYIW